MTLNKKVKVLKYLNNKEQNNKLIIHISMCIYILFTVS